MSLDLVKNALYQAIRAGVPGLTVFPEPVAFAQETYPNLRFIEVSTDNLGIKTGLERVTIATGKPLPAPPFLIIPVLTRKTSRFRMQLRDTIADSVSDPTTAYQRLRDQHNALDRFFSKLERITIDAAPRATLAEIELRGDRTDYDAASGVFLSEFEVDVKNWRLLDTGPGIATYRADSIEVAVVRERDGRELVTRISPISAPQGG